MSSLNTTSVRNEILRFGGPDRSQDFESLVAIIAQCTWPQLRLHRGRHGHEGGGPDWLLVDSAGKIKVMIEAKAYNSERTISPSKIKKQFLRGDPTIRVARDCIRILAIPVEISKKMRGRLAPLRCRIWDAVELSRIVTEIRFLASLLGLLDNRDIILRSNLSLLAARSGRYGGVSVATIANESADSGDPTGIEPPTRGSGVICLHGPPFTGKSCWAIRQAFRFIRQGHSHAPRTGYILNAGALQSDLVSTLLELPSLDRSFVIIDDIHQLGATLIREVAEAVDKSRNNQDPSSPGPVYAIISREADHLVHFRTGDALNVVHGIHRVPELVYRRLVESGLPLWKATTAVLYGALTPSLANDFRAAERSGASDYHEGDWAIHSREIAHAVRTSYRRLLLDRHTTLGDDGYHLYVFLLCFSAINWSVEVDFVRDAGFVHYRTVNSLVSAGLAVVRTVDGTESVSLIEHPAQAARLVRELDSMPERDIAARWRDSHMGSDSTFAGTVIAAYLRWTYARKRFLTSGEWGPGVCDAMQQNAEWSGMAATLAKALKVVRAAPWMEFSHQDEINRRYLKLARNSVGHEPAMFSDALHNGAAYWNDRRGNRSGSRNERQDLVMYELGYLSYLQCNYRDAERYFRNSALESAKLIAAVSRMTLDTIGFDRARDQAAACLCNIWIAAYLQHLAPLRDRVLSCVISGGPGSFDVEADAIHSIWTALRRANRALLQQDRSLMVAEFTAALRTVTGASDALVVGEGLEYIVQNIQDAPSREALGRHEINGWVHMQQARSWPVLYLDKEGVSRKSLETYRPTFTPWRDANSLEWFGQRGRLLDAMDVSRSAWGTGRASGIRCDAKSTDAKEKLLLLVSVIRGSGEFEYIGDAMVAVMRCAADDNERAAIAEVVLDQNVVPQLGMNDLPKRFAAKVLDDILKRGI